MRRAAAALVAFVVLGYFGPLTPAALTFFTVLAATEIVGLMTLRRVGIRAGLPRPASRLLHSH